MYVEYLNQQSRAETIITCLNFTPQTIAMIPRSPEAHSNCNSQNCFTHEFVSVPLTIAH